MDTNLKYTTSWASRVIAFNSFFLYVFAKIMTTSASLESFETRQLVEKQVEIAFWREKNAFRALLLEI